MKKYLPILAIILTFNASVIAQKKVLFLGNSFTKNTYSVPATFLGMCNAAGIAVTVDFRTQGGMAVATEQIPGHWVDATSQNKIKAQKWDYIVVQDNQGNYVNSITSWALAANTTLFGQIKANDTCTRIVYFAGWGPKAGTFSGDNAVNCINRIHNNMVVLNNNIADEIVSPIGKAWVTSMSQLPAVDLYSSDNVHPSLDGVYLTAATIFTTIFKTDLTNVNYTAGVNPTTAQTMRTIAFSTVTNAAIYPASNLNAFTPTITVNGNVLTCNGTYTTYQWYANGSPVGTNSNTYTTTANGIHKVVVTNPLTCSMSSFEVIVSSVDVPSIEIQSNELIVNTMPNNNFEFSSSEFGLLTIRDVQGRLIYSVQKNANTALIDLSDKAQGLYIVTLQNDETQRSQKIIVR